MRKLALAAIAAMTVGACATNGNGNGNGAATARPAIAGAQYCWADRLAAIGQRLNCNWAPSREAACAGADAAFSTVDGSGYHYPRTVTCPGGLRLVELAPKA